MASGFDHVEIVEPAPPTAPAHGCVDRLSQLVADRDTDKLDEVVSLIAHLAIRIDVLSD